MKKVIMVAVKNVNLRELYEVDDSLWLEKTVELLRERKYHQLDLENLIEELEDLGRERKHQMASLLEQIIRHLLLLQYWEVERERNSNHWEAEIVGFRTQIKRKMTTNFYNYLSENFERIYQDARLYVSKKSKLNIFPSQCPYTLEQLLDQDWFPETELK